MPVIPQDFLLIADELLNLDQEGQPEALLRTVVNRSYLASVLEAARILTPLVGEFPEDHEFYTAVEAALALRLAPKSKDKLVDLRRRRKIADYELHARVTREMARNALNLAHYVFGLLGQEVV